MRRRLPRHGSIVKTPDGEAEVIDTNALTETVKVRITLKDGTFDIEEYDLKEITVKSRKKEASVKEEEIIVDDEIKSLLDN